MTKRGTPPLAIRLAAVRRRSCQRTSTRSRASPFGFGTTTILARVLCAMRRPTCLYSPMSDFGNTYTAFLGFLGFGTPARIFRSGLIQKDPVSVGILHEFAGNRPEVRLRIDVLPSHLQEFSPTLRRHQSEPKPGADVR